MLCTVQRNGDKSRNFNTPCLQHLMEVGKLTEKLKLVERQCQDLEAKVNPL